MSREGVVPGKITSHDRRKRRCPMLGHSVEFSYCRSLEGASLCRRIFDCWWEEFDVISFVRNTYGKEEIEKILAPRKPKILSLADMIAQAQGERNNRDRGDNC